MTEEYYVLAVEIDGTTKYLNTGDWMYGRGLKTEMYQATKFVSWLDINLYSHYGQAGKNPDAVYFMLVIDSKGN